MQSGKASLRTSLVVADRTASLRKPYFDYGRRGGTPTFGTTWRGTASFVEIGPCRLSTRLSTLSLLDRDRERYSRLQGRSQCIYIGPSTHSCIMYQTVYLHAYHSRLSEGKANSNWLSMEEEMQDDDKETCLINDLQLKERLQRPTVADQILLPIVFQLMNLNDQLQQMTQSKLVEILGDWDKQSIPHGRKWLTPHRTAANGHSGLLPSVAGITLILCLLGR
ncbi:hypothetical protein N7539_005948 [Penicillium diatomitis]|uniref:Uncharacterized protein n=1 Tax=Penicillium diatomitis TaxID=2819901 RepID=A0A9W9X579_9EURO|nr:uncharacterized protein N7539_005948 [Penicillium diatomitis]KAJ5484152.1 hypothetical protein N7539_005948 [Penicillium diatomitis]